MLIQPALDVNSIFPLNLTILQDLALLLSYRVSVWLCFMASAKPVFESNSLVPRMPMNEWRINGRFELDLKTPSGAFYLINSSVLLESAKTADFINSDLAALWISAPIVPLKHLFSGGSGRYCRVLVFSYNVVPRSSQIDQSKWGRICSTGYLRPLLKCWVCLKGLFIDLLKRFPQEKRG